ncbi:histone H3.v1-like [Triticum urartu]|uniref:histone H3.v1-like n=1 Tax=Triticum urartu TaxID=4572 RepID=UPI0020441CFE|nr:histone H3.v1-like [Triticum urartu]
MFEPTTPALAGKGFGARHRWKMLLSLGLGVAGAGYAAYRFYNAHQKKLVQVEEEEDIIKQQLQGQFEEVKEEQEEGKEEQEEQGEEEEEQQQQVLPPLPEADRDWKSYYYRSWDHVLPPPTLQLASSLPRIPRQPHKTKWSK